METKLDPEILKSLSNMKKRKNELLAYGHKMLSADDGKTYPVDLLAVGAINRILSLSDGIQLLIESSNMLCTRSLLRLQIDTALRFSALFIVKEPHTLALKILDGEQINKIKDASGNKMTDAYLRSKLEPEYPWISKVYKNLSGYIHLSDQHMIAPAQKSSDSEKSIEFILNGKDTRYPKSSWIEVIDCFNEATDIFLKYLRGWITAKANSDLT